MKKKEKKRFKKKIIFFYEWIRKYIVSHMWCSFAFAVALCMGILCLFIFGYLKNQYYTYLVGTAYSTEETVLDTVHQNIENQISDFVNIGSTISVDSELAYSIVMYAEESEEIYAGKSLRILLQKVVSTSGAIIGAAVAGEDGIVYQYDKYEMTGSSRMPIWKDEMQEEIIDVFLNMKKEMPFSVPKYRIMTKPKKHPNLQDERLIHIAFPLRKAWNYRNTKYALILSFDMGSIYNLLKQINESQEDYIGAYIETTDGELLLNTERIMRDSFNKEIIDLSAEIKEYGWIVHAVIDKALMRKKVNEMYTGVLVFLFMIVVIIFLILFYTLSRILRPVNSISQATNHVKKGDMKKPILIQGENEIWQLAQSYNEMLLAIQEANDEVARQHERMIQYMKMKQRAEREALESQINAHFICNTLNAINYEAIDSGNYKVSILLKKLSNILRYTFDQKHQNVFLKQEISWIEQYLFLQKERMGNVFDYEIDFDMDYENWPCRKLMLQPFVENSIIHGFEGLEQGGHIKIIGEGFKEYLKLVIEDNGCGMDEKRAALIQKVIETPIIANDAEVGIGISNVIIRMRMYYGEQMKVSMQTKYGEGTKFTFILPVPEKG